MKAKTFLRGVRDGLKEIKMIEENIARTRDKAFPGSLQLKQDLVQESARSDRLSGIEARVHDLQATMEKRLKKLYEDQEYAERVISELENSKHRQVLTLYYLTSSDTFEEAGANKIPIVGVYNLSWDDVATKMGFNTSYVKMLHTEALDEFDRAAYL